MDYNSEKIYTVSLTEREWMLITNTLWLDHNFELSEKIENIIEKKKNKMTGSVKWFNNKYGYGFITNEEGKDVFVHYSGINTNDKFKVLDSGCKVSFNTETDERGLLRAVDVQLV